MLRNVAIFGGRLFAQYEKNASSRLRLFELDGKPVQEISLPTVGTVGGITGSDPGIGGRWDRKEAFFDFSSFSVPPSVYQVDIASAKTKLWDKVDAPGIDASAYDVKQLWYGSKDGTKAQCLSFTKKAWLWMATIQPS